MINPVEKPTKKLCSQCDKNKRYKNRRLCYRCIRSNEREKKLLQLQKKKERKQSTKKYQESERKKLHKECWTLMSKFIRLYWSDDNGYVTCLTCGKRMYWKGEGAQAGHLFHGRLDFEFNNLSIQCVGCNHYNSGMREVYILRLIDRIGLNHVRELEQKTNTKGNDYPLIELDKIKEELDRNIKRLTYKDRGGLN